MTIKELGRGPGKDIQQILRALEVYLRDFREVSSIKASIKVHTDENTVL